MTNPNEPTLTCSEVVERLRCQVIHQGYPAGTTCITKRDFAIREPQTFQRTYHEEIVAKKHYCSDCYATDEILWRERRVQELEELGGKLRCENEWMRSLKPEELSYRNGVIDGFQEAHEPARCGHARGNWKDPKYGTPEYAGDERCEICAQLTPAFGLLQEVLNYGAESATSFGGLKLKISKFLHSEWREQIRKGATSEL